QGTVAARRRRGRPEPGKSAGGRRVPPRIRSQRGNSPGPPPDIPRQSTVNFGDSRVTQGEACCRLCPENPAVPPRFQKPFVRKTETDTDIPREGNSSEGHVPDDSYFSRPVCEGHPERK